MGINSPLTEILKLTKPQIAAFKKLGLTITRDLLMHLPYRYLDFSKTVEIKNLKPGEDISIKVKIKSISSRFSFRSRLSLAEAVVSDDTGNIKVVWFNQAYLAKTLKVDDEIFLSGQPEVYKNTLQLTNPLYEKVSDFPVHTARLVPVYHLTQNLYPRTLRNSVKTVLEAANEIKEVLPEAIIKNQGLMSISEAVKVSHFPEELEKVEAAQKRFNFEELFISQLLAQKHKMENVEKGAYTVSFDQRLIKKFVDSLPFQLTSEQKQAAWDILQDLEKPEPMNRLLEGDVGSGKTLVAFIAALQAMAEGFQVALLAPTEILAKQHFATAQKFLTACKIHGREFCKSFILTNSFSASSESDLKKTDLQKIIKKGTSGLYIGTHALLQDKIKFKKLALVIIDEQHRFGVEQRAHLINTGEKVPHLLSLSATPIPRTLKLAFTGELDISQIKHKPQGRKNIVTKLVSDIGRIKAYQFIAQEIKNGKQAFVITPLIEEGANDIKSAKLEAENLAKVFPHLKIGLLHGKMKGADKEAVMSEFLANNLQILVSTSVVEVGVDVPNASVMLIEGAERFGLAQLHQFRGRVGRAEHLSYCFVFTSQDSPKIKKRLEDFSKTQDGFQLAELDLKTRGFGELYGSEQSGLNFKYFDPAYTSLIAPAREQARQLLSADINLEKYPALQTKIKEKTIHLE